MNRRRTFLCVTSGRVRKGSKVVKATCDAGSFATRQEWIDHQRTSGHHSHVRGSFTPGERR